MGTSLACENRGNLVHDSVLICLHRNSEYHHCSPACGSGFANFRETATKTNSLVDHLEALTLPDPDDVADGLRAISKQPMSLYLWQMNTLRVRHE